MDIAHVKRNDILRSDCAVDTDILSCFLMATYYPGLNVYSGALLLYIWMIYGEEKKINLCVSHIGQVLEDSPMQTSGSFGCYINKQL